MNTEAVNEYNVYLFHQGTNYQSYKMFGAHLTELNGKKGVLFNLWAPKARLVNVVGEFNSWCGKDHYMTRVSDLGIWSIFIPGLEEGTCYKYEIHTYSGDIYLKADPFGVYAERRPCSASVVFDLDGFTWTDGDWLERRSRSNVYNEPLLIYEVHLGSWKRKENNNFLTYRELAEELVDYAAEMGYTHIELMPVMEHPHDGSWGYQITGYYSVTSRFGSPHDFMYFVNKCHEKGIGVILDWVPGHFCKDGHGLFNFDGTPMYEYHNTIKKENVQWGTANFDLGKPEVRSFLISNALFWMDMYHIDGLRIDAVASMLYLDYAKEPGQWEPNQFGGRENLEAIEFMKMLNQAVFEKYPNTLMIAEESTSWPLVTKPTYMGGLGYNYKWNVGWMNDMLKYMEMDPIYRKWHHNLITFSFFYAFSENFILPLSHDEVVHGKKSLIDKMPGDYWRKFAGLRTLYGYMMTHPGKKLLFMSGEFGQFIEWDEKKSLDWHLLEYDMHQKLHNYVKALNHLYLKEKALWEQDHEWQGFKWIDPNNYNQSIIVFLRYSKTPDDYLIVICNFTPVVYENYRIGIPELVEYNEIFNSDKDVFGGSNQLNNAINMAEPLRWHNQPYSLQIKVPPMAVVILKPVINSCLEYKGKEC